MKSSTVLFSFILLCCSTALAVTLTVVNTEDSGAGSLRQAISDSNSGDTITFHSNLSGQTIVLTNGQLAIDKSLVIDASTLPDGLIIDGNSASHIFEVASNTTNELKGLILINGLASGSWHDKAGGAIYLVSDAILTVNNCTLTGNSAVFGGAISLHSGAVLTVGNSTLSGNYASYDSGGIDNNGGTLTLIQTTLAGNVAARDGGGIRNAGTLILSCSTLSSNSAAVKGGGIRNDGGILIMDNSTLSSNSATVNGGGIYGGSGTVTLNNSTLSSNSAGGDGGGIWVVSSIITLNNCTLSGNSATDLCGGIGSGGSSTVTLNNTIVAANTAAGYTNINFTPGGVSNLTTGDPLLAPLGGYGGPTQTMPPLSGSPAIDAGQDTGSLPAVDQRGYPRVLGSAVDIGACEHGFVGCGITCSSLVEGITLEWIAIPTWEFTVMYSTNLVKMPFTDMSAPMAYPVNIFTDTVHGAVSECFYKIETSP